MSSIQTLKLTDDEFDSTFRPGMVDIMGREDQEEPGYVIDLQPYLRAIPEEELSSHPLLDGVPPAAVRRNREDGFDHVLYPVRQANTYLVVIVRVQQGDVLGHYILDLQPGDASP